MTKTLKLQLYYKDDDVLGFKEAQEALWQLLRETRAASNRIIQLCWEYNGFESDWKKNANRTKFDSGEYPTKEERKEILGKSLQSVIYDRIKQDAPSLNTENLASTLQAVMGKFNSLKKDIMRGSVSIPSFKSDLPIDLHKDCIVLDCVKDENGTAEWFFRLSLFSNAKKKELGLKTSSLKFKAVIKKKTAGSYYSILERCFDNVYHICGSKLKYDGGKWFLLLCFSFERDINAPTPDKNRIMGVHIGEHNAVSCVLCGSERKYTIEGGEVKAFTAQIEKRRRSIGMASKKHSKLCSDGRVGHGYHAKMQPLEKIGKKISNFRNTVNHRYSRQIVDWAVENKCGVIQIEDLTGFATKELEKYKLLRNWSYYDLTTKVESKAREYGIEVVKLGYANLRRLCPDCHTLNVEEMELPNLLHLISTGENTQLSETRYVCRKCGRAFDLDYIVESAVAIPYFDLNQCKEEQIEVSPLMRGHSGSGKAFSVKENNS